MLVAIAVGQTVERTGQIMISFHFRWWLAHARTRTTVAVVVSRAINKRETIAAVHIHSNTRAQVVDLLRFIITPRAILWSCIPPTYLYELLFFLETRPKPNGPAKKRVRWHSGGLLRWNAIKYRSPGTERTSADSVDFRKNRGGRANENKNGNNSKRHMGPPLRARATKLSRVATRSYRTGHGRENQRAHGNGSDGRRKTTTLDDGRPTIASRRQKHRAAVAGRATRATYIRLRRGRVRRRRSADGYRGCGFVRTSALSASTACTRNIQPSSLYSTML